MTTLGELVRDRKEKQAIPSCIKAGAARFDPVIEALKFLALDESRPIEGKFGSDS